VSSSVNPLADVKFHWTWSSYPNGLAAEPIDGAATALKPVDDDDMHVVTVRVLSTIRISWELSGTGPKIAAEIHNPQTWVSSFDMASIE
jgi:hypothetical protein